MNGIINFYVENMVLLTNNFYRNLDNLFYKSFNLALLDQIIVSGSNFISTILLVRLLKLNDFGIFATFWLILLLINSLHVAVIVFPMMTIAPKKDDNSFYFGSLFLFQALFSVGVYFVSFVILFFYVKILNIKLSLIIIGLFCLLISIFHLQDFFRRYFFIEKKYKDAFVIDLISYFFRILTFFIILKKFFKTNLLVIILIINGYFLIGSLYGYLKFKYKFSLKSLKNDWQRQWNLTKWLLPSGLMQWTSINFFMIIASYLLGPAIIGILRMCQNIINAFNILFQAMENFVPVDASRIYKEKGITGLYAYLINISKYGVVILGFFEFLLSIFSKYIIIFLYGKEYINYFKVIIIFSVILIFIFLWIILRIFLRTIEKTKIWYKAYFVTSIYSLIIAYPLVKLFGIYGVVIGMISAYFILIGTVLFFIKKEVKIVDR